MLFHVVNDRHGTKRTMIFTTTKPLTGWGRVLHDEDLAHAIVDRMVVVYARRAINADQASWA
jgi:DNA replication protein DnaC